jgi:hypothetical protein
VWNRTYFYRLEVFNTNRPLTSWSDFRQAGPRSIRPPPYRHSTATPTSSATEEVDPTLPSTVDRWSRRGWRRCNDHPRPTSSGAVLSPVALANAPTLRRPRVCRCPHRLPQQMTAPVR